MLARNRDSLRNLRGLLLASCHAPDCKRPKNCPRQCGCRSRRTFKLNTETAICWELADHMSHIVRIDRPNKQELRDLLIKARSYQDLSRFHMTEGWQRFFLNIIRYIERVINPNTNAWTTCGDWDTEPEDRISYLKASLKRLKRYPRT